MGWRAEAMRTWNVEVFVATLDDAVRDGIRAAQLRQTMVNDPAAESASAS